MTMASTDKYTISIMAIKAWQDIWARTFTELPLRVTLEYLIQSELDWLNQDFKHLISNQARSFLNITVFIMPNEIFNKSLNFLGF